MMIAFVVIYIVYMLVGAVGFTGGFTQPTCRQRVPSLVEINPEAKSF